MIKKNLGKKIKKVRTRTNKLLKKGKKRAVKRYGKGVLGRIEW